MPNPAVPAGRQQEEADANFASLAQALGLRVWSPGDAIPPGKRRVLIGVATYALLDMQLLDRLVPLLQRDTTDEAVVEVFNVRDVRSMNDFDSFIAGIGPVFQTPAAGLWERGRLVETATGASARDAIIRWLSTKNGQPRFPSSAVQGRGDKVAG